MFTSKSSIIPKLILLIFISMICNPIDGIDAFLEGFAASVTQMNEQMTKFMEGVHQSVDSWADKVIDNAKNEECFYICPKGQPVVPNENYTYKATGCVTFGMLVKEEDLPTRTMKHCCDQQQNCYHKCNSTKTECDNKFQDCLHQKCLNISEDFKQVIVCDTATKLLLMGILSFGCKTFKDAQKQACICPSID